MRDSRLIDFYNSKQWRHLRAYYKRLRHGICERCGNATIQKNPNLKLEVHHKKPIDINLLHTEKHLQEVALNINNLELLCTSCHNSERSGLTREGLMFDGEGNLVEVKTAPPPKP